MTTRSAAWPAVVLFGCAVLAGALPPRANAARANDLTIVTLSRDTLRRREITALVEDSIVILRSGRTIHIPVDSLWFVIEHRRKFGPALAGVVIGAVAGTYAGSEIGAAQPVSGDWAGLSRTMHALDGGLIGLATGSVVGGLVG
ncbi:hypothetical protein EG831_09560, partial [bacterium]|nr:hypothetical protein [bacterium]